MPTITFVRVERDCPANKNRRDPHTNRTRQAIYDYNVMIDGEHRVTWCRNVGATGYELRVADNDAYIMIDNGQAGWGKDSVRAESKHEFEGVISGLLPAERIPTLAQIAAARRERAAVAERERKAGVEAHRIYLIKEAGVELYKALKHIAEHSGERSIRAVAATALTKAEKREDA